MSSLRRLLTIAVTHDARRADALHTDALHTDRADRLDHARSMPRRLSSGPAGAAALDAAAARAGHAHASTLLSLR